MNRSLTNGKQEDTSGPENSICKSKRVRRNQEQNENLDSHSQGPGEAEEISEGTGESLEGAREKRQSQNQEESSKINMAAGG